MTVLNLAEARSPSLTATLLALTATHVLLSRDQLSESSIDRLSPTMPIVRVNIPYSYQFILVSISEGD